MTDDEKKELFKRIIDKKYDDGNLTRRLILLDEKMRKTIEEKNEILNRLKANEREQISIASNIEMLLDLINESMKPKE
jgi:hypothetical protein